jgi:ankyrin repeat protein
MLDKDPALASVTDSAGLPALAVAIYHRKTGIAQLLEQKGARFDLFLGAMAGRPDEVRRALEASPDTVNHYSADGWTALHLTAFFGCVECARILLDAGAKANERSQNPMENMPLHAAAAGRQIEIVRLLLARGAWVNARQHGGWTALHAAAQNGDIAMAELLIAAGADVQARADNQQGPWDLALTKGHQQMAEILEHYGANGQ